uniref:Synaptosomal-associated protein n=1 Tax=Plectus sambesii TaxID=2011161 RepID=A0A914UHN3_9BILA
MKTNKTVGDMEQEINYVADESLASTRRMVAYVEEANTTGINTLALLDDQGATLERVEGSLHVINEQMRETQTHLEKFQKCCGLCVLPWNRRKRYENAPQSSAGWHRSSKKAVISEQPRIVARNNDNRRRSQTGYFTRITNDDREEEMDQNLSTVDTIVENLHKMATDMHVDITQQNELIDRVSGLVDANKDRMDDTNKRVSILIAK